MTPPLFFALVSIGLFILGFYILCTEPHWLRKIMALNVMGNSVFLYLIAMANRISDEIDVLPQALVFFGIIILVNFTALAIKIVQQLIRETGKTQFPKDMGEFD
jgi:multicomponent Na+:H+ antiporter subunit C